MEIVVEQIKLHRVHCSYKDSAIKKKFMGETFETAEE